MEELLSFTQVKADAKLWFITVYNTYTIATLFYVALNK